MFSSTNTSNISNNSLLNSKSNTDYNKEFEDYVSKEIEEIKPEVNSI